MSGCCLARCQQDRKIIRREFNKWTKNLLLQIGLETISKNHLDFNINSFHRTNEEQIPIDFNPNETCLFCLNRQEYFSNKKMNQIKTNYTEPMVNDDENSPLDLSLKSTSNLNSRSFFDLKSDILPIYNPEEFLLTNPLNFDYLSQSFPNLNLFSSLPINQQYPFNSSLIQEDYIAQLAKQMAYVRMIEAIENQRNNKNSNGITHSFHPSSSSSSILTESINVNHVIHDIMIRTLNEIFEEQTKVSKQGELLFIKKQNHNNDDRTMMNTNKQHQHNNQINPSSSSSSSTSSVSSRCSPSAITKTKKTSKSNHSSTHTSKRRRRPRDISANSKVSISMDGKQIRPKRGQYRRYESEQLAKAVAAVLSNEMSVHKAGSYFGVPHSTLEYKVKERNSKITTKNKDELSPRASSMPISDNNNNISQTKSMEYDDGDDNDELSLCKTIHMNENPHELAAEEIPSYIPIELKTN